MNKHLAVLVDIRVQMPIIIYVLHMICYDIL